jgi:hypothetical protein
MILRLGTRWTGVVLAAAASAWSCSGSSTSETGLPAAGTSTGATGSGSSGSGTGSDTSTSAGSGSTGSAATTGSGTSGSGSTADATSATTSSAAASGSGGAGGASTSGAGGASTTGSAGAATVGAGGAATTSGTGGAGTGGGAMGPCTPLTNVTLAVHVIINVSWPGDNVKTKPGTGKVHLWNRSKLAINGTMLSGDDTMGCGSVLPEFELGTIGGVLVGGTKVLVEIPTAAWDAATMPKFHSQGILAGWTIGSKADLEPTVALVGVKMTTPMGPWPTAADIASQMLAVDSDGDMKPGLTADPRNGSPYTFPPTSGIGIGPKADKLYLATRTVVTLHGQLTTCETLAGSADIPFFDNHVIGCHVQGGNDCDPSQATFVDSSRTIYQVTGAASFTAKKVPDGASCTDVRNALPM